MEISIKDIKHLANLSSLSFSDDELEKFVEEFKDILDFVNQINDAKIDEEINYEIKDFDDLREDVAVKGLKQEEVLLNAPSKRLGSFSVPLMME